MQPLPRRPARAHLRLLLSLLCLLALSGRWAGAQEGELDRSLMRAILQGDAKKTEVLLKQGADPNAKTEPWATNRREDGFYGETALTLAAVLGDVKTVDVLLKQGADPNLRDGDVSEDTPLTAAAEQSRVAAAPKMATRRPSQRAIRRVIQLLLDRGAKVDTPNNFGSTPLALAAYYGQSLDIMKLLLARGANIEAEDMVRATPLHYACMANRQDAVKLLLDRGAQMNHRDREGHTPLMDAAYAGDVGVIRLLLRRGADPLLRNKNDDTALSAAEFWKHPEAAKVLRKAMEDRMKRDRHG